MEAVFVANPTRYREFNWLLGTNETIKPRIEHKLRKLEKAREFSCPQCNSTNIHRYFIDEQCNEIKPNNNPLSKEGKCLNCGYDDELSNFIR